MSRSSFPPSRSPARTSRNAQNLQQRTHAAMHQIRIIGGQWKRTPLTVVHAEGLRPTPDRVRETLYNWLEHLFAHDFSRVHVLDAFAGSGALGLEAASRGAASVTLLETQPAACAQVQRVCEKLQARQVQLLREDAYTALPRLARAGRRFDLILLDPPFSRQHLPRVLPLCLPLLAPGGLLYVEAEMPLAQLDPVLLSDWQLVRNLQAGQVAAHLLQRNNNAPEAG